MVKVMTHKFFGIVRPKGLNGAIKLSTDFMKESSKCFKNFRSIFEKKDPSHTGVIIDKANKIFHFINARERGGTPNIRMNNLEGFSAADIGKTRE